ncbi:MAG: nucleotidyl transferase AbiEii/AbiGii toxin family protein [Pirellulales bacterium]|nr:nucleotidyl transferase AbiEii/AbiGii toxin family protein [Pirellulales bacterium]
MYDFAELPTDERRLYFEQAAARIGMSPSSMEKDFWVCWVLKSIFSSHETRQHLVFKGGTSLSKVYGVIERFSEDVDLILDWRLLGYGEKEDPYQDLPSRTQQDRFNREFNTRAERYIAESLCPQLQNLFGRCREVNTAIDRQDPQTINVQYPAAFSFSYLLPIVRLEIGPLASYVPHGSFTIKPYVADVFPDVFDDVDCPVVAIKAERTFWEKATILHQQAHRSGEMPARYSRHYYDMHMLAMSDIKYIALANLPLLADVVRFKARFYNCPWAKYNEARPGTFKIIPQDEHVSALRKDYRDMVEMFFGEVPDFNQILETLGQLEIEINRLS